jgi:hypothetical protein
VVDAGATPAEKPAQETVGSDRLEDFEPPSPVETPLPEPVRPGRSAVISRAAQHAREHGRSVGHTLDGDGDVVEQYF